MIINLLINFILLIFGTLFVFLPVVSLASIPLVGSFISSGLISVVKLWNTFLDTFPYAVLPWHIFIYVILPFELLLLVARFFLGHRLPVNNN